METSSAGYNAIGMEDGCDSPTGPNGPTPSKMDVIRRASANKAAAAATLEDAQQAFEYLNTEEVSQEEPPEAVPLLATCKVEKLNKAIKGLKCKTTRLVAKYALDRLSTLELAEPPKTEEHLLHLFEDKELSDSLVVNEAVIGVVPTGKTRSDDGKMLKKWLQCAESAGSGYKTVAKSAGAEDTTFDFTLEQLIALHERFALIHRSNKNYTERLVAGHDFKNRFRAVEIEWGDLSQVDTAEEKYLQEKAFHLKMLQDTRMQFVNMLKHRRHLVEEEGMAEMVVKDRSEALMELDDYQAQIKALYEEKQNIKYGNMRSFSKRWDEFLVEFRATLDELHELATLAFPVGTINQKLRDCRTHIDAEWENIAKREYQDMALALQGRPEGHVSSRDEEMRQYFLRAAISFRTTCERRDLVAWYYKAIRDVAPSTISALNAFTDTKGGRLNALEKEKKKIAKTLNENVFELSKQEDGLREAMHKALKLGMETLRVIIAKCVSKTLTKNGKKALKELRRQSSTISKDGDNTTQEGTEDNSDSEASSISSGDSDAEGLTSGQWTPRQGVSQGLPTSTTQA